jgi:integrase
MFNSKKQPPISNGHDDQLPKKRWKPKGHTLSDCIHFLTQVLKKHNHHDAESAGGVSYATSRARQDILNQGFKYLHEHGYKIVNVRNFNTTHMRVLAHHWESQPLSASTLQLRFSVFRTFCTWIGKKGMVGDAAEYLSNPKLAKRTYVAKKDKGWVVKGVEILPKIGEVFAKDPFVGIQLLLMWAFGLRAREAWQFRPVVADMVDVAAVNWGTKGGLDRKVPIRNPWQRQVLAMAKGYANDSTGSMIPSRYTRIQWQAYFYRVCRRCGISRANGYVAHGLRHECANDLYKELTGENSPVRGGALQVEEYLLKLDALARLIVSKTLGHSREAIVGQYCGNARKKKTKKPE